jgi:hypothetical protein
MAKSFVTKMNDIAWRSRGKDLGVAGAVWQKSWNGEVGSLFIVKSIACGYRL